MPFNTHGHGTKSTVRGLVLNIAVQEKHIAASSVRLKRLEDAKRRKYEHIGMKQPTVHPMTESPGTKSDLRCE